MERAVGVRELRGSASRILKQVRERGDVIDITYRGETIARIVPVGPAAPLDLAIWAEVDLLAAEIGRAWKPKRRRASAEVSAGRRA